LMILTREGSLVKIINSFSHQIKIFG